VFLSGSCILSLFGFDSLVFECWVNTCRNDYYDFIKCHQTLKVRSHQKRRDFFVRPNPMKSQRTDARGCNRRNIFPDGAFRATHFQRNFRSELKYFNFEAIIPQLGPISSRVAPRVIAVTQLLNQNKTDNNVMNTITYIIYYNVMNTITAFRCSALVALEAEVFQT